MPSKGELTRERIMKAAERLFGAGGYDAASLRAIASAAGVQQPLLHYHFGSKIGLYQAVWERRYAAPEMRQDALADLDFSMDREELLRTLVKQLIAPPLKLGSTKQGRAFLRVLNWEINDPRAEKRGILAKYIQPIDQQVLAAPAKALPNLPLERVAETRSLIFGLVSSVLNSLGMGDRPIKISPASLVQLVEFAIGGLMRIENMGN